MTFSHAMGLIHAMTVCAVVAGCQASARSWTFPEPAQLPTHQGLPDPLTRLDGTRLEDPADWPEHRRYLKAMLEHYMYGQMPPKPGHVRWVMLGREEILEGDAILEHLELIVERKGRTASVRAALLRPNRPGRFPVIIKNDRILFDKTRLNEKEMIWADEHPVNFKQQAFANKEAVRRGYVLFKFLRGDVASDNAERRHEGVMGLYPDYDEWGAIAAWGWAYQFIIDGLIQRDDIDAEKIVVTGHSRGGKTALCAGIYDERIAITAPNSSGAGGTASWRFFDPEPSKQTLKSHDPRFIHWWSPRLFAFVGQEERLPFDAHTLKAAIAPRALFNAHARQDYWANPYGTALTYLAAQPVFEWLGAGDHHALHWRDGGHAQNEEDWAALFDFCDLIFFGKPTERTFEINPHPDRYEFDSILSADRD